MTEGLNPMDLTGVSFWLLSAAMTAATFFFFMERDRAVGKWKTSLSVAALVTGIAAIHYFYMRGVWVSTGESPTTYRYVDWLLTVPLQIIEFYLILAAIAVVRAALFWKLLVASVVMLVFGYLGEIGQMSAWPAFISAPLLGYTSFTKYFLVRPAKSTPTMVRRRVRRHLMHFVGS